MYEKFLTAKSVFFRQQTFILFLVYFLIRFVSFIVAHHPFIQGLIVFFILIIFGMLCFKNRDIALYVLLGEIILGGSGHMFELLSLSIRSLLFLTFIILWMIESMANDERELYSFPKELYFLLAALAVFVAWSCAVGLYNGNGFRSVWQDFTPYSFFLLIFPSYYLLGKSHGQEYMMRLAIVFVWASAIFSLFNFIIFSTGQTFIQSPYYKWIRDVGAGKITDMGNGFFRIVFPENLLIVPAIIMLAALLMRNEKHHKMWWLLLLPTTLILVLNFSRIYFLAVIAGLFILKYKHSFLRWFSITTLIITCYIFVFSAVNILFSHNQTANFDLLLGRAASVYQPDTETSSLTRITLLGPIFTLIGKHPIIGNGLGSKISFIDPSKSTFVSTAQFDWGYLELFAELGIFGFISFISLVIYIIYNLIHKIRSVADYHDFYVGALGSVAAFLIMNITSPILFHALGVFFLTLIIVLISKPHTLLDEIVVILYRTFRRLKA